MTSDKQKILVITSTFPRWKNDTDPPFVFELCKRLVDTFNVSVLCPHAPGLQKTETMDQIDVKRFQYFLQSFQCLAYSGGIMDKLKQNRLRCLLLPFFVSAEFFSTVFFLIKKRVNLLNPHWAIPQGVICLITRDILRFKIPVICSLHGSDVFGVRGKTGRLLLKYVIKRSDAIVVVSDAIKKELTSVTRHDNRIHVIPMGVDLQNRFVSGKSKKHIKSILFVGRLIKQKGADCLISAFSSVIKKHPDANLTIIGSGREEENLKQIVKRLNLDLYINFKGAVANDKIVEHYKNSEVFVFPSIETEGFGLVMVEAMGCECAVVASDLPATREIIKDMETGLIFKKGSVEHLAEKINFLFENPEFRNTVGEKARKSVLKRFDWEIVSQGYRTLFRDYT